MAIYRDNGIRVEFNNGYEISLTYFPGRAKPCIVLSKDGEYLTHAVITDDAGLPEFRVFLESLFGKAEEIAREAV